MGFFLGRRGLHAIQGKRERGCAFIVFSLRFKNVLGILSGVHFVRSTSVYNTYDVGLNFAIS